MSDEVQRITAAYREFMREKYPAEIPATPQFQYFDPHDSIPDRGLAFLPLDRKLMLTDQRDIGLAQALRITLKARRKPRAAGWHIAIGPGWMYLADTVEAAVALFVALKAEVRNGERSPGKRTQTN